MLISSRILPNFDYMRLHLPFSCKIRFMSNYFIKMFIFSRIYAALLFAFLMQYIQYVFIVLNIFTTKLYARACSTYEHFLGKLLRNKLMKQGHQQSRLRTTFRNVLVSTMTLLHYTTYHQMLSRVFH